MKHVYELFLRSNVKSGASRELPASSSQESTCNEQLFPVGNTATWGTETMLRNYYRTQITMVSYEMN